MKSKLKRSGAFAAGLATCFLFFGHLLSTSANGQRPVELLVVGDSLVFGQGLEEKDKFYTLIKDWLGREAFGSSREVNLKVKAHSGSTVKFHPDEAEKYKKAGRDESYTYFPEVNVSFPSSMKQIEVAADEYRSEGKSGADLILLTGCITDITTSRVYDPKGDDDELRREAKKYCQDDMLELLERAAKLHPNALIAVIGYFPAISPESSGPKLLNAWLEARNYSKFKKAMVNNPIMRKFLFERSRKRAIERSRIWVEESDKNLAAAVESFNTKQGKTTAVFVRSPLTERDAAETPNTKLFRMRKDGVVEDPLAAKRIKACNEELPKLKAETGIDFPVRLCEIAAIGHPNPEGAKAYADAIRSAILPLLR